MRLDLNYAQLIYMVSGQISSTSYTVSVMPKADGTRPSNVKLVIKETTYEVTLRNRICAAA